MSIEPRPISQCDLLTARQFAYKSHRGCAYVWKRDSLTEDELSALKTVRTHASGASPVSTRQSPFPVLVFSHGDQMNAFLYSSLHEELASRGYVVLAVDHPHLALFVAYPDGSVVRYSDAARPSPNVPQYASALPRYLRAQLAEREADLRFVRDQLKDLEVTGRRVGDFVSSRIGAIGHSSGGLAAALLCQKPPVVDACLNMDGRLDAAPFVVDAGRLQPSRPFMYMTKPFRALTDAELRTEGITREQATRVQADANEQDRGRLASAGPPSYRVTLRHAKHSSFSDEPLLLNPGDAKSLSVMRIIRGLVAEFFDATVANRPQGLLQSRSNDDLDVEVFARPPAR